MVEHIVLFKLDDDVTDVQKQFVVDRLSSLRSVAGIIDLSIGLNHSQEGLSKGFHVGMRITFKQQADLDAYLPNETHQQVVADIQPHFTDVIVVDYTY